MVYVVGASSLKGALATLTKVQLSRLNGRFKAIEGLSLNPNTKNPEKRLQYYLRGELAQEKDIVIWHDLLNNSISKHSSNNFRAQSITDLKITLARYKDQISAVVVCQRKYRGVTTPNLYKPLKETGILTLGVLRDLISNRKAKVLAKEYWKLHQKPKIELKSFYTIRNFSYNLARLTTKRKKFHGIRARRAFKNRQLQVASNQEA